MLFRSSSTSLEPVPLRSCGNFAHKALNIPLPSAVHCRTRVSLHVSQRVTSVNPAPPGSCKLALSTTVLLPESQSTSPRWNASINTLSTLHLPTALQLANYNVAHYNAADYNTARSPTLPSSMISTSYPFGCLQIHAPGNDADSYRFPTHPGACTSCSLCVSCACCS